MEMSSPDLWLLEWPGGLRGLERSSLLEVLTAGDPLLEVLTRTHQTSRRHKRAHFFCLEVPVCVATLTHSAQCTVSLVCRLTHRMSIS